MVVLTVDRSDGHAEDTGEKENAKFPVVSECTPEDRKGSGNMRAGKTTSTNSTSCLDELIQT